MSVFTPITSAELSDFLKSYPVGELVGFEGISAGIENSNFFVTVKNRAGSEGQSRYVLTIFETISAAELPFCLGLTAHLYEQGIACPAPLPNDAGLLFSELKGKPAALVTCLNGSEIESKNPTNLGEIGQILARLHTASAGFLLRRDNSRGDTWWDAAIPELLPKLSAEDAELVVDEQHEQLKFEREQLPHGIAHADLFVDNALFQGDRLSGLIDFYYACNEYLLYDVAVTANDWCRRDSHDLDHSLLQAFMDAYHTTRRLTAAEQAAWPMMLRRAAFRFWISRLKDWHFPREGLMTHQKDPNELKSLMLWHRQNTCYFPSPS